MTIISYKKQIEHLAMQKGVRVQDVYKLAGVNISTYFRHQGNYTEMSYAVAKQIADAMESERGAL